MRKFFRILAITASVSVLAVSAGFQSAYAADDAKQEEKKMTPADEGKEIAFDRKLGNCLACHMIAGGDMTGNIGPPLIGMAARFPDKEKLRAQIYDARVANPDTIMIPFGPMGVLNDEQIDKVVEYISTL
ncbi:sulfur oxidation c-type cytochrome SoxX [Thiothrix nivea]|uniref:Monoheme cytochrome SoxX (Sulfur oxidation) n=1 Tax=Thiothrix nivea (strain ATCC 35100 / DSM 5205 / JP2) TaxID=870187 RepID=A0A656HBY3_THINJ|nr:sulfur oxidation c-type cytochrome SoxX [Thiothrix nivea]EIJ34661.1 monoheme cytochrome SoxX (sulfur oxidation) [Thiothrix nivea DSM 5205]